MIHPTALKFRVVMSIFIRGTIHSKQQWIAIQPCPVQGQFNFVFQPDDIVPRIEKDVKYHGHILHGTSAQGKVLPHNPARIRFARDRM